MKLKEIQRKFKPLQEPVTPEEAEIEAARCLFCFDAPCTQACPTRVDVPGFIRKISTGNLKGAARSLYEKNYLAGGCARVCPTEELCEGACVLNELQRRPVQIARLQRFATDWAIQNRVDVLFPGKPTGRRVAIVGAGPAGFSCAAELARIGHKAVIFEAREKSGGLYTHGIARYKLTSSFTGKEIRMLRRLGIRIKSNTKIGKDIPFQDLMGKYDAVFLGIGQGKTASLDIPGGNLRGVVEGLSFLEKTRIKPLDKIRVGKRVTVIGGGNTAIDSALAAKRLGAADVTVIYRRSAREMPAYKKEVDMARLEDIRIIWLAAPLQIIGSRRVEGIKCLKMRLGKPDASGRPRPLPVKGSDFVLPSDMVIAALGQVSLEGILEKIGGLRLQRGKILTDEKTGETSVPRLFAGGDCTTGGGEMVNAVAEGIRAARGIDAMLKKE